MKKIILYIFLLISSLFITESVFAQKKCKVLNEAINESYVGKCKKGLAHGKGIAKGKETYEGNFKNGVPNGIGTYYYIDGSSYKGEWKNGLRNGDGQLISIVNGIEAVTQGIWKDDIYIGEKPPIQYQVKNKIGVDRFSLTKEGNQHHRILIQFFQNGGINTSVENLRLESSSGRQISIPHYDGYEYVEFPFTIKISYITLNKFRTSRNEVKLEIVINEPGDWSLDIHN